MSSILTVRDGWLVQEVNDNGIDLRNILFKRTLHRIDAMRCQSQYGRFFQQGVKCCVDCLYEVFVFEFATERKEQRE